MQRNDSAMTSEEAAVLLHVSPLHVKALADSGVLFEVPDASSGHRRISRASVLAYKEKIKRIQAQGLDAMVAATESLGLYDLELESLPTRKRK